MVAATVLVMDGGLRERTWSRLHCASRLPSPVLCALVLCDHRACDCHTRSRYSMDQTVWSHDSRLLSQPSASGTTRLTLSFAPGGHAYWIALAFGPHWGFQAGYWTWVANCVSCALISSLTVAFFADNVGGPDRSTAEEIVRQGLPIVLALLGFFSLRRVGQIVSVLLIGVLAIYFVRRTAQDRTMNGWAPGSLNAHSLLARLPPLDASHQWHNRRSGLGRRGRSTVLRRQRCESLCPSVVSVRERFSEHSRGRCEPSEQPHV